MTLADLKRLLAAGSEWDVTNHYINRPDHPCFGTKRRVIVRNTTGGFWLSHPEMPNGNRIAWPKAAQVREENGAVLIFGHPTPDALFLTLTPVKKG